MRILKKVNALTVSVEPRHLETSKIQHWVAREAAISETRECAFYGVIFLSEKMRDLIQESSIDELLKEELHVAQLWVFDAERFQHS